MEFRRFNLREKLKCELELGLASMAHNLKKMKSWIKKMIERNGGGMKIRELGKTLGHLSA